MRNAVKLPPAAGAGGHAYRAVAAGNLESDGGAQVRGHSLVVWN